MENSAQLEPANPKRASNRQTRQSIRMTDYHLTRPNKTHLNKESIIPVTETQQP